MKIKKAGFLFKKGIYHRIVNFSNMFFLFLKNKKIILFYLQLKNVPHFELNGMHFDYPFLFTFFKPVNTSNYAVLCLNGPGLQMATMFPTAVFAVSQSFQETRMTTPLHSAIRWAQGTLV